MFWWTHFLSWVLDGLTKDIKIGFRIKTDEVCCHGVRRVCSPCQSVVGWRPFISCARLMKSEAIFNQFTSQCVVSVAGRWFLIGVVAWLSSRIWVSATCLICVSHHWSLTSLLMLVSPPLVVCSCCRLLIESSCTCCVVGEKTWLL